MNKAEPMAEYKNAFFFYNYKCWSGMTNFRIHDKDQCIKFLHTLIIHGHNDDFENSIEGENYMKNIKNKKVMGLNAREKDPNYPKEERFNKMKAYLIKLEK